MSRVDRNWRLFLHSFSPRLTIRQSLVMLYGRDSANKMMEEMIARGTDQAEFNGGYMVDFMRNTVRMVSHHKTKEASSLLGRECARAMDEVVKSVIKKVEDAKHY